MVRDRWLKFYPDDWLHDTALAKCSLATQGVYIRLICALHTSDPYGYIPWLSGVYNPDSTPDSTPDNSRIDSVKHTLKNLDTSGIIRILGVHHKTFYTALKELITNDVLKVDERGVYSARMLRDLQEREEMRRRGRLGGNPQLVKLEVKQERKNEVKQELKQCAEKEVKPDIRIRNKNKEYKNKEESALGKISPDASRLAELLLALIREHLPHLKEPDMDKWAIIMDRMLRLDGRDPAEAEEVIRWCQADEFWRANILSPQKLRDKYDQLLAHMQRAGRRKAPAGLAGLEALEEAGL